MLTQVFFYVALAIAFCSGIYLYRDTKDEKLRWELHAMVILTASCIAVLLILVMAGIKS